MYCDCSQCRHTPVIHRSYTLQFQFENIGKEKFCHILEDTMKLWFAVSASTFHCAYENCWVSIHFSVCIWKLQTNEWVFM